MSPTSYRTAPPRANAERVNDRSTLGNRPLDRLRLVAEAKTSADRRFLRSCAALALGPGEKRPGRPLSSRLQAAQQRLLSRLQRETQRLARNTRQEGANDPA